MGAAWKVCLFKTVGSAIRISILNPNVPSAYMELDLSVSDGALTFPDMDKIDFVNSTSNGGTSVDIIGTPDNINAALDGLTYTPGSSFSGADSLSLTAYQSSASTSTSFTERWRMVMMARCAATETTCELA